MAFVIDISNASSEKLGSAHGLSRQALMELSPAYAQIHDEIVKQAAFLPHVNAHQNLEKAQTLYAELVSYSGPIVVVGDSGVVASLKAHSLEQCAVWVGDPSPDLLSKITDWSDVLLIALDGPTWVRDLVQALSGVVSKCIVFAGDGSDYDGWTPADSESIVENGVSDARFAPFTSIGLAFALLAGCDADALSKTIDVARSRALQEGLFENPAFLLSALFLAHERRGAAKRAQLVFAESSWNNWAEWASALWCAFSNQEYEADGRRRRFGGECAFSKLSNESHLQQLLVSPNEHVNLLILADYPLIAEPNPITQVAWEWNKLLTNGFVRAMQEGRRPLCKMTIDNLGLHHLYELSYIWLHSALVTSALRVEDPLQMKGADRFRRIVSELARHRNRQE